MEKINKIRLLPTDLINVIAAGEVIERPSSVVKELVENSIDANSTIIKVNIEDYGKNLIEVIDNGIGMNEVDAVMAFRQHATSKINTKEDLENILSLGFRGEALASITSVSSKVEMETKEDNSNAILLVANNTEIMKKPSSRIERGTRLSIYNLFENIPARKKFLKTDNTELKNIINTFLDIALINTHIHFELSHNNKSVYKLTKSENIKERMFEIWGELTSDFYDESTTDNNLCKISLILQNPEKAKKNSNFQYIYVNGRRIDSKVIQSAAKEAFRGFIHKDLKPSYIILIHINPKNVDVNVHPRKLEVRFEDPQSIFRTVYSSIKKVLETKTHQSLNQTIERVRQTENNFIDNLKNAPTNYTNIKYITNKTSSNPTKVQDAISFSKQLLYAPTFEGTAIIDTTNYQKPTNLRQYFNTYILYEIEDRIVFIDQHAAAEKINFERLLYQVGEVKTKPLLIPTIIELKDYEKHTILENKENLRDIGVVFEDFGGNSIQVSEIPELLKDFSFHSYIEAIINNKDDFSWIRTEYSDVKLSTELYSLLALTACHGSIRAGQQLTENEMLNIIHDLKNLKQPNNCPHGRPISWTLKKQEIEKNFKRVI